MAVIRSRTRDGVGKGVARQLRRDGRIPGVLYGAGGKNFNLSLDTNFWVKLLETDGHNLRTRPSTLVVDGEDRPSAVLLRDMQVDPVTDTPLHIDLLRFDPERELDIEIPVVVTGEEESPGVKIGGVVNLVRHNLEVHCKAKNIPEEIVISVATFNIGDVLHINDITLPDGVEVISDVNFTIATIIGAQAEVADEEEVVEEAEGEAAAEGDEES